MGAVKRAEFEKGLKSGFGILEVLVGAAVLGFLYIAVLNLQSGNRDALLRIRGRDGATEVAQQIIDSLGALGLASLSDTAITNEDGERKLIINPIERVWSGQPGILSHDMKIIYNAEVEVSPDDDYRASVTSDLLEVDSVKHVFAKRLDVTVSWKYKNSTQSIQVSGVVR